MMMMMMKMGYVGTSAHRRQGKGLEGLVSGHWDDDDDDDDGVCGY